MQLPATTEEPQQPLYTVSAADKKRVETIASAWKAYNDQLDPPLIPMPGEPDDNVLSNRCQQVVDRGVDFLFGKELELSVEDSAPQEAQDFLDQTWGRKEARMPLLQKLAMNGALAGTAYLRIVPSPDDNVRLVVLDPATVFVQTAPQDCETVQLYCIEYCQDEQMNGKAEHVYYHEEITRVDPSPQDDIDGYEDSNADGLDQDVTWEIQHWTRIGDRGKWQKVGAPIAWAYPFAPIFACQNLPLPNSFYGTPDVTSGIIGLNKALNLTQSNIQRTIKLYGHPFLYSTGTGESSVDRAPGKIANLPPDGKIAAVPLTSDIANALASAGNLRSDIDEQSSVPGVATGRIEVMPRGQMSGIAIELLFMPLLKKTDKKQCLYGELIIDVCKGLLVLNGMSGDIDITLTWINPLPEDDLQSLQAAVLKKQVGISNTSIQRSLGVDPEEELELSQKEDSQALNNYSQGVGLPPTQPHPMLAGQQIGNTA